MASKPKQFQSVGGRRVSITVPGKGWIELGGDDPYETDDPAVIEALEGNADVEVVKAKKAEPEGKAKK